MSTLKRVFVIALAVVILSVAVGTPAQADGSTTSRTPTINVCWMFNKGYPLNYVFWMPAPYGYDLYICKIDGWDYYMSWGGGKQ